MITGTEIGFGGIVVGALGLLVSPLTAYLGAKLSRSHEHAQWLREQRYVAYSAMIKQQTAHQDWRKRYFVNADDYNEPNRSDELSAAQVIASKAVHAALAETVDAWDDYETTVMSNIIQKGLEPEKMRDYNALERLDQAATKAERNSMAVMRAELAVPTKVERSDRPGKRIGG